MPEHHPIERDGDVTAAVIGGEVPCPTIEFRPHHGVSVTRSELCSNEGDHDDCQHLTTKPGKRQRWVMLGIEVKSSVHTCAPSMRGGSEPIARRKPRRCRVGITMP